MTRATPAADLLIRVSPAVRADPETGTYAGWAVRWDVRDAYGTEFAPGCFGAGTDDLSAAFPLLWFHDPYEPIGTFSAQERDEGLWIEGAWDDSREGETARARARGGSAPNLSVGFVPKTVEVHDENDDYYERFTACRLVETSQITLGFQAVPGAALESARARPLAVSALDRADTSRALVARARLRLVTTLARR